MFRFYSFALIAAFVPALVLATPFNLCTVGPGPNSLNITGCIQPPCRLVRDTYATMTMSFAHEDVVEEATVVVIATAFGATAPYPLPSEMSNVCNRLDIGECPLDSFEDALYNLEMLVSEDYPITALDIQVEIRDRTDGKDNIISCFWVAAETVLS